MKTKFVLFTGGAVCLLAATAAHAADSQEALEVCAGSPSDSSDLQSGCECMVEASSGDDALLAEIVELSKLDSDADRQNAASPELAEIIGQCFAM